MYSERSRVRISECDGSAKMSLPAILNRLQDTAENHDLSMGLGTKIVKSYGRYYVLLSWDIKIYRELELNEIIEVKTYLNKKRHCFGMRSFEIVDENGEVVISASSNTGLCSTETSHLADTPDEMMVKQQIDDYCAHPIITLSNKLEFSNFTHKKHFTVSPFLTDFNHHVNNANYAYFLMEHIDTDEIITDLRIYYNNPSFANEELISHVCYNDSEKIIMITSLEGEVRITASVKTKKRA